MTKTTNYQLPQWEKTDRIMMDDFNDAMASIDAGVAAKADASAIPKISAGTYRGDGAAERTISLGFTPKVVYLCPANNMLSRDNSKFYGGLAADGSPATSPYGHIIYSIVSGGFRITCDTTTYSPYQYFTNQSGTTYHYFALG